MSSVEEFEKHRVALTGHCYRMLGSIVDANDAVQETMIRAWRARESFQERSSVRTWLYRIATNVCLDNLSDTKKRERPFELGHVGTVHDELVALPAERWIEPCPDAHCVPSDEDPQRQLIMRQSIRLAFITAMQHLPPKQRAALLLTEVLGWSVSDAADCLLTTAASINSALQRARATLSTRDLSLEPVVLSSTQRELVNRYVLAFEQYDVETLVSLLKQDAIMSMPPYSLWLQGRQSIGDWLVGRGCGCQGSRLVTTAACGSPAFGQYRQPSPGVFQPWAVVVLELGDDKIEKQTFFLDTERLFPLFGLGAL